MQLDGDLKPPTEELHPDPLTVFSYPKFKGLMRMEGEPHLTAWGFMGGSLKSEDLGFQQVASDGDLIFPQHVLGGYFVVGQEEKGRMSPLHMLEEPDRQGEIIQGPHPLPQAGRETGPCQQNCATDGWVVGPGMSKTALCPVDLTPEPSQRYLPHRWEHAPPSSNGFSEFNLPWPDLPQIPHLISGFSPNGDKLDLPDLPSPSETASLPPMVSILEAHQVPLSPIGNRPWITGHTLTLDWSWPQGNDVDNRYCESVLPRTGQNTAGKHYVPPGDGLHGAWEPYMPPEPDRPRCPESTLYTDNVNIAPSISDVLLPAGVPHGQLLMSESCLLVDTDQLSQSESCLIPDSDHLPQFDACLPPATDHLPQSEACLPPATDQLHQSEWCLPSATDQLPQSESCLHPDTNQLLQSKSCLLPPIDQLPQSESCLPPDTDQLPQSQACLSPCQLPGSESYLPFSYLPLPQSSLPPGNLYIPLSDSCVVSASHQLPPPVFSLAPDSVTGPLSEFCLPADPVQVSDSSLAPDSKSELLTDPTLTSISDQGLPPTSYLTPDSDSLLLSGVDPSSSAAYLPVGENESPPENVQLPKSQTFLFSEDEPAVLFHCSLTPDSRTGPLDYPWPFLKSEEQPLPDYDVHGNVGELALSHSCVSPESDPFQSIEQLCVPKTDYLPLSGVVSENEQLVMSESGGDSETEQLLLSECGNISQAEQLVKSESIVVCVTEQLVLSESGSASETEQLVLSESGSASETEQLVLSESGVSETEQLVLSESDGDSENEQLSLSEFCNVSQTELLVLSESGNVSQTEHLVLSESGSAAETEQLVLSESGSASETEQPVLSESGVSETEQLVLSEFDGDSENEQLSLSESGNVSQTEHLVLSESGSAAETEHLVLSESGSAAETEHLVLSESGSAAETEQLVLSESGISETEQLVLSESDGDSETEQLSLSESGNVSQTEQLVLSESGVSETEQLVLSESDGDSENEQLSLSEFCNVSQTELLVLSESGNVSQTEHLVLSESGSAAETEQLVLSESGSASETEQPVLSESGVSETEQLVLSEFDGDSENEQLSLSESGNVSQTEHLVLSESGSAAETEHLVLSESGSAAETEQLVLSESGISETEQLVLSESDGDSETEQLSLSESGNVSQTEQLVLSESGSAAEAEHLVLSESGSAAETEQIVLSETALASDSEQLVLSESGVVSVTEQLVLSESGSLAEYEEVVVSESGVLSETEQLVLIKSDAVSETQKLELSESNSVFETDQLVLSDSSAVTEFDQPVLFESGVASDTELLILSEYSGVSEMEQLILSVTNVFETKKLILSESNDSETEQLVLSELSADSETEQLVLSELGADSETEQLVLSELGADSETEQLVLSEFNVAHETEKPELSQSGWVTHSDQSAWCDSGLITDTGQPAKSEPGLAPVTDQLILPNTGMAPAANHPALSSSGMVPDPGQPILSELCWVPNTDQLVLSESGLTPDNDKFNPNTEHPTLSEPSLPPDTILTLSDSALILDTDQLFLSECCLVNAPDQLALPESTRGPDFEQLAFSMSKTDLALDTNKLPMSELILAPDPEQQAMSDSSLTLDTEHLDLSESDTAPDTKRLTAEFNLDRDPEQLVLSECDLSIVSNEFVFCESSLTPDPEQLVLSEFQFSTATIQLPMSESSFSHDCETLELSESELATDSKQLILSDSNVTPDEQLVLSDSDLGTYTNQLAMSDSSLAPASNPALSESSLAFHTEQLVLSESDLAPNTKHLTLPDCNLTPYEQLLLSESDNNQPATPECSWTPCTEQLELSESDLTPDEQPVLFESDVAIHTNQSESSWAPCTEQRVLRESDFTPVTRKLALSESSLASNTELLVTCESGLASDIGKLFLSDSSLAPDPDELPLSESGLAPDTTELNLAESDVTFAVDHLPITQSSLTADIEEPPLYKSGLAPDTEQPHLSVSTLTSDTNKNPFSDYTVTADHAYLPLHESCNSPNTSHLPIAEHNLSHDPDWLPFAEPDTKYPQGVPSGSTSLKESPLSFEPCLTPDTYPSNDTEQVSLSESYLTPINEQLPSPEVCQWFQSSLVLHADHMPQRQSESPEAKLVIHGKGYPLEWEFRDDDLFQTHVSFSGETEEPSLYESVFLSNRLSPSKLPYTNTEQAHLAEPRFPPGTGQLPLVDFLLDCDLVPSSNTNLLLNSGQNSFQVHEIEVGLPPPSDIFTGLSPESHELACTVEDLFSIFSPDTTQEPKGLSPNPDHLTLSDDFLSLTEVFAHLEEDPIHPNRMNEKGHQGCDLSRALTKFGPDYGTEPFVFAQLDPLFSNEQFLVSQQQSPSANVRLAHCGIGLPVEGIRFPIIQADTTVKTEQPVRCNSEDRFTPACFESSLEHLHKEREETPFLNLDLLFDPDNLQHEGGDSHFSIETTQIPLPQIDSLSENTKSPSSDVTDHLTGGDLGVKNALLPLSYSGSAITTGFLPLSNTDPLSPVANQLSPLNPDFEPQKLSSFHLDTVQLNQLDINLATEIIKSQEVSFAENSQLPLIVVTDPVDLCSESPEAVEMQSLHPMENVTPYLEVHPAECSHMPEPQVEEPLEPDQLTPRDTKGHSPVLQSVEPQERRHQPPSQERSHLDDDDLSSCDVADTFPHCQPGLQYEDHQLMSSSAPLKLSLSFISSTFETGALLSCDVTVRQPGSTQDSSTSATLVEELDCDPGLGFSVDSDASCLGDEMLRLRAVFDALDRDKDGFVKMEDFVQFATVYGAEQVKYLTSYLDPAGLGVINFRDFYRGISEIQNEDLDMQLYDMGYPSEEEPPCSVDFDDLAAFEVTEVTDSAYVGSESAYSECETFTDEDTSALAAQEDPETEGDGVHRLHPPATPEGLEISLCDISVITVQSQEEQFEDFGEGAEPDLYSNQCDEEEEEESNLTQPISSSSRISSSGAPVSERQLLAPPQCTVGGGLYCSQCHKHVNRLEDLSTRLRYLEMDSPDKRTSSRKEARRLHNSSYLSEDTMDRQLTDMSYDETDLTDKVLYLEQRVSELEREAGTTGEQQNRLRQENLQLLHRAHALEEQLKDQELRSDEVQNEETRKHRDELRKMERDRGFELSSLKARVQELETENFELRSQLPNAKATTQRLEEENQKLRDQVDELRRQVKENKELNQKLGGRLNMEKHKQQGERERSQEVIEELRRELEQVQLLRLEMEHRLGLGNSAALQEYNSRTRETELEQEVRKLKQEQRSLKEQNEELNGQIINLSIQGAKNLFSTTFSDSLAAEISSVSRDELMEAIQKQEEINLRLQDYIDRIIVAIMETNPAILEVKIH